MELSKDGKAVSTTVNFWYDERSKCMHLTIADPIAKHLSFTGNPNSPRGLPDLFNALSECLKLAGAPHPKGE